jgi:PAS domain S-box-containing protein
MPDFTEPTSVAGEALFLQFVQTVEDHAIFVMDPQERIVHWNAGAKRIMGFDAADVLGHPLYAIFTPEDCAAGIPRLEIETAARVGRAADERWHVRKDGSRFWGLGAVTPIRATNGTLLGFGKIVADRTDLKQLQDTLQSRSEALARADELKNRFLATLAHELRNPQSVLANSVGVLRRHAASDAQVRVVAEMIERQVHQTQRLIEDLSDLALAPRAGVSSYGCSKWTCVRLRAWPRKRRKERSPSVDTSSGCRCRTCRCRSPATRTASSRSWSTC